MLPESNFFHDPDQFAWVAILKSHFNLIQKEWQDSPLHLRQPRELSYLGKKLEKDDSRWDIVFLMHRQNIRVEMEPFFPITMSLLSKIPIFENLAFSIFYPGTETIQHRGWSKDIVRVHLAIESTDNAALCCGGYCRTLKAGEVLIFEDGEDHYAYNRSAKERIILLFDVLKTSLQPQN